MPKHAAVLLFCCAAVGGCQIEDVYIYRDAGLSPEPAVRFASIAELYSYLEAEPWLMSAADIPTHPNGYDENVNFGQATQCLHEATMRVQNRAFAIASRLGTLKDAPRSGDSGSCDRSSANGSDLSFDTTAALIENMRGGGACFDITLTYSGFGQEGRGGVRDDGAVGLELYFRDQAIGHRCADGDVGARTVTLNQESFTGDAVQVYRGSEAAVKRAWCVAYLFGQLACQPGTYYLVDPPAEDAGRRPGVGTRLDGGSSPGADLGVDLGVVMMPPGGDAGSVSHPDAQTMERDADNNNPPPPPPPSGAPYDHAAENASDLARALDITGHYGVALAGGHLLASNASGGHGFPRETPVSSAGTIHIPPGATVRHAMFYYTGIIFQKPHTGGQGDYTNDVGGALDNDADVRGNGIRFSIDGMRHGPFDPSTRLAPNPSTLGSESVISPRAYAPAFGTLNGVRESVWGNRLDLTGLFQGKSGDVDISVEPPEKLDINGNNATQNGGNPAGQTQYNLCTGAASWSLMVIYELASLPEKNLVLMDGAWARAWDYLFFHSGVWHRPKVRIDHAPIRRGARFYIYAGSSSPGGHPLPTNPACSCGCGGQYTLKNNPGPYGRNDYFSDVLLDPPAAASDPIHRDRTNGPWYLHSTGSTGVAGNDWTLIQSGQVYTEFPNLYEGEEAPAADNIQPVTNEDDPEVTGDVYGGHPWNGRGTVTYHGNGNANSTVEVALDDARITPGETSSYVFLKADQKDVWKPQQVVSVKYILFETPTQ